MNVTRYVALDARTGELVGTDSYLNIDELEHDGGLAGYNVIPHAIEVDLAPPPFRVHTVDNDGTLVLRLDNELVDLELVQRYGDALEAALGARWVILHAEGAHIAGSRPSAADEAPERLPWSHYSPELTTALKELLERFPHRTVADAAVTLADMIDDHGPDAVAEARAQRRREASRRR